MPPDQFGEKQQQSERREFHKINDTFQTVLIHRSRNPLRPVTHRQSSVSNREGGGRPDVSCVRFPLHPSSTLPGAARRRLERESDLPRRSAAPAAILTSLALLRTRRLISPKDEGRSDAQCPGMTSQAKRGTSALCKGGQGRRQRAPRNASHRDVDEHRRSTVRLPRLDPPTLASCALRRASEFFFSHLHCCSEERIQFLPFCVGGG